MLYESPFITIYSIFLAAVIGACMGSFLNCMGYRIVRGENLNGRSHCDRCGHVLGMGDLVPVFSYIIHRGRCKYCGEKLSCRHVICELIAAAVMVSILLKFNISFQALKYALFACIIMGCAFADLEGYIIPDRYIVSGVCLYLGSLFFEENAKDTLIDGLAGGIIVAGFTLIVVLIFEKIKNVEAMGGGDIKLLFVTGLFLGLGCNVLCLVVACVVGIAMFVVAPAGSEPQEDGASDELEESVKPSESRAEEPKAPAEPASKAASVGAGGTEESAAADSTDSKDGESADADSTVSEGALPWGPSIAIAAWVCLLFGDKFVNWYLSLL